MKGVRRLWQWLRWLLAGLLLLALGYYLLPREELYPPGLSFSSVLRDHTGRVIHLSLAKDGRYRIRTDLAAVSPQVVEATLLLEDQHFYEHPGINPLSLLRALYGVATGSRLGGGSTISMQLARLRFRLETRSLSGKCQQMLRALQLERHYEKEEILAAYLTLAPYGGNVESITAAAWLWCEKSPAELTAREAVSLAVLPQSPSRRKPRLQEKNTALATAQYRLWQRWQAVHGLGSSALDADFSLRAEARPPREAPHLARRLATKEDVTSTLHLEKQRVIETCLQDYLSLRQEIGMSNACALLVHAPSREVLAYAGSAAFLSTDIQGQVDGITARRSPGSALKPFIYGLALDQGLIHPQSLLKDGQVSFGSYNPENYDRQFVGPISAADALFRSRNIPALTLHRRLKGTGLYALLKDAGVQLPHPASWYGLALPLGGAEVSLEEMALLYAMIAHDGCAKPLQLVKPSTQPSAGRQLLSPQSCYLLRRMLASRVDEQGLDDTTISWKTGTSHGFRDAWAAGIRGDYVLVVWIGNFNGKSNPAFVARDSAAPLLHELFHRLRLPYREDSSPEGVREVELCAVSGSLPCPHCQHRSQGWFVPGVSPIVPCTLHRLVFLDATTGKRLPADDGRPGLRREVHEFWQPDMLALFRAAGVPRRALPELEQMSQSITTSSTGSAPLILSPQHQLVYALRNSDAQRQSLPLKAEVSPGVQRLYWFAGGEYLGQSKPSEALPWSPKAGEWEVQVLDDAGRSSTCTVTVERVW
jgi:penicillin-binding protein 1C